MKGFRLIPPRKANVERFYEGFPPYRLHKSRRPQNDPTAIQIPKTKKEDAPTPGHPLYSGEVNFGMSKMAKKTKYSINKEQSPKLWGVRSAANSLYHHPSWKN
ncbi:hypothetical protein V7128_14230 [Neobacillus vireti]|uniref:hypothetical protein n=1 Tax=Neobacillus vireti TaxID=220686 RepID=UPI002FFE6BD2